MYQGFQTWEGRRREPKRRMLKVRNANVFHAGATYPVLPARNPGILILTPSRPQRMSREHKKKASTLTKPSGCSAVSRGVLSTSQLGWSSFLNLPARLTSPPMPTPHPPLTFLFEACAELLPSVAVRGIEHQQHVSKSTCFVGMTVGWGLLRALLNRPNTPGTSASPG